MSVFSGPNTQSNGLVFYYSSTNFQKSWKGKPTSNLLPNPDFTNGVTGYFSYVGGAPTTVIVTDFPESLGTPKIVLQCTSAAAPGGGGNSGGMIFSNPTLTPGLSYTISFWARIISHSSAINTFSNQSGSGDQSNFSFSRTITSEWNKYSFTTSSLNLMKSNWYVWTNLNSATWQYADFQIEQNNFATPFVNGTRSNTQAIFDLIGKNSITADSLTYSSNNSFSFNGVNDYITLQDQAIPIQSSSYTIESWIKRATLNAAHGIIGDLQYDYQTFHVNASNKLVSQHRRLSDNLDNIITSVGSISTNWTHVAVVFDITAGKRLYINGVLDNSNTSTTEFSFIASNRGPKYIGRSHPTTFANTPRFFNGQIDDLKGYLKALSANEILQNFESTRGRFGI